MINFLLLMIVPMLLSIGLLFWKYHRNGYSWTGLLRDAGIQIGAVTIVVLIGLGIAYYQGTSDTEILNGQVTDKKNVRVSCGHSYPCNPYPCNCDKNGCSTCWNTCYEHSYDVDWRVYSSIGYHSNIDRVDRQGLKMPSRWGNAYIGEPYSVEHNFRNYIKANPKSVLLGQKGDLEKFGKLIPPYPEVYDYYHTNHFINVGVPNVDSKVWNYLLSMENRSLGPSKQVNLIVIIVPTDDPAYVYAFRDKWLGGKKNDAIILIGSLDGHEIAWADVVSWSTNKEFAIYVRDRIMERKYLDHKDAIVRRCCAAAAA